MKLHILSDLHLEFAPFHPPATDADVVILAGDIHVGKKAIDWAKTNFPDKPVLYILGNHEYYGKAFPKHVEDLKQLAAGSNIHVLENDRHTIGSVTFLGCTLWTDFQLFGDPRIAGAQATERMNDYRKIRVSPEYRKLRSLDTAIIHRKSRRWLESELANQAPQTVVITHHAPSDRSIPADYQGHMLSAAYASRLDDLVAQSGAALWVHGHIHSQQNYTIGGTPIVCNPRGYPDEPNPQFQPGLTIAL
jgi:Icc-related predicted phosphoesterase